MMARSPSLRAVALFLLLAPAHTAMAHHLWVEAVQENYMIARGHFPDQYEAYQPDRVSTAAAYARNGRPLQLIRHETEESVAYTADQDVALFVVRCDWGHRSITTQGRRFLTREAAEAEGYRVLQAFMSTHYSKAVFADCALMQRPLGMTLEILLQTNPFDDLQPDDELVVQVLFDGEPLADAAILANGEDAGRTDADGIIVIEMPEDGVRLLHTRHDAPVTDSDELDFHRFMSFLTLPPR